MQLCFDHLSSNGPKIVRFPIVGHISRSIEAPKPTPNREIPKTLRSHELFQKVRANFIKIPCETSQEPNRNCSEKLVQMNFFILGGLFGWLFLV